MVLKIRYSQTWNDDFHVKLSAGDKSLFALALESFKNSIPPYQRSYNPQTREWFVDAGASLSLERWFSSCRKHYSAVVEFDGDPGGEVPHAEKPKPSDPYATLHLLPSAPPEVVKAAYRALSMIHHPDKGGDTRAMQKVNEAYRQLAA